MCTAISLPGGFFGRNLDLEATPGERVVFCPASRLPAPRLAPPVCRSALLGMAHPAHGTPLFYDAMNGHGLAMAALNFPGVCVYHAPRADRVNLAPFEVIPYVLSACHTMAQARALLERVNLADVPFSPDLPNTPLHFMLTDGEESLVLESTADGLHLYDNPAHVMTNSPAFPYHMQRLADFMPLTRGPAPDRLGVPGLNAHSRGMGAFGLPGDLSSSSRFVRAAFCRAAGACPDGVSPTMHLLHLLDFAAVPRGCVQLEDGRFSYTVYACSMDLNEKCYYYRTYGGGRVHRACMADMQLSAT